MREAAAALRAPASTAADRIVAGSAVALAGLGAAVSLQGVGSGSLPYLIAGGCVLAACLLLLLIVGWLDGSLMVLLALPLPALYSTESARVAPALLVTALVCGAWLVRQGTESRRLAVGALPARSMVFLLFAALLSAVFAQQLTTALREVVNLILLLTLLVLLTDELRHDRAKAAALPIWIAAVAGVSGIFAVLQTVGVIPTRFDVSGSSLLRATLGFGWPNEAGMFFALSLPFTAHVIRVSRGQALRVLGVLAAIACLAGLLATYSRGSWIAVLVAPSALVLVGARGAALRFWILVAVGAVLLNVVIGGVFYARIASLIGDYVVEQRGALMLAGVLMFLAHPLVGVGPGGFGASLEQFGPQIEWLYDYTGSAHNAYVHSAAEMGAVGLIAFVAFFGSCFVALLRSARRGRMDASSSLVETSLRDTAFWAFATACLVSFVEWPLAHGVGQLIILTAALGFAMSHGPARRPAR